MDQSRWHLAQARYGQTKDQKYDLAVLPWGATEPHNYHLPFGTDVFETERIAHRACELAAGEGAKVVCLPTVPFGTQTNQQGFPFALNLNPTTQFAILQDLCESLENSNVPKLVILNGHGGNDFTWMIRQSYGTLDLFLAQVNWYRLGDQSIFDDPGDHGGEMETSLCMHLVPELTGPLDEADAAEVPSFSVDLFNIGKAKASRPWERLTRSTGVGNPQPATAEKGERYFASATRELADFLVQLARAPMDEQFPFAGPPA